MFFTYDNRATGRAGGADAAVVPTHNYGHARQGGTSAVPYSAQPRAELGSSAHGTELQGGERYRLKGKENDDIRPASTSMSTRATASRGGQALLIIPSPKGQ